MKVLLLAGGDSSEREVSLNSGAAIFNSLKKLGHDVFAIDPSTGQSLLSANGKFLTGAMSSNIEAGSVPQIGAMALAKSITGQELHDFEVVFLALHGGKGENGSIQNLLELAKIPFTGSDMKASAIAMDKATTKRLLESAKILTPKWGVYKISNGVISTEVIRDVKKKFKFPIIVKPNDGGSTIGLTKVTKVPEIQKAFETALKESNEILVEDYIKGRELTVPVIDGVPLPVIEIIPKSGLYDYEAKYTKGKTEYIVPAKIPAKKAKELQKSAVNVFEIVGASGLARIDFMMAKSGKSYCLEINTLPGMTELSLSPMAAKASGISFDQLVERIVDSAVQNFKKR
ncbi:MAG TPA: D-alanine--D-alanine ligase [candidate division Zixibacteria bacterium]|nr:D-alanine--D-alanine ligase [candidate division Zixibacteria bacterium]